MMGTKFTLADLRVHLAVRLAVAPRHWFKRLWEPKARPYERDATRQELVTFITHGWDSLDIEATGPEPPSGHVPYSAVDTISETAQLESTELARRDEARTD